MERRTESPIARRRLLVFAATAFIAATVTLPSTRPARALGNEDAGAFLSSLTSRAIDQLTDMSVADGERKTRFRGLFRENFDIPAIGRFVLGRYWRPTSAEAREAFLDIFEDVMVERFAPQFAGYAGTAFRIAAVRPLNEDSEFVVRSTFTPPGGEPLMVDWRVRQLNGSFKVLDVLGEGVSMALTLRSEYASVIKSSGGRVEGLTAMLRERIAEAH